MNFAIVSRHVPDPEGTAAGRILAATCSGLLAEGHSVRVWSWGTDPPATELPAWCEWHRVVPPRGWARLRSYLRPVTEVLQTGWPGPADPEAAVIADDPPSWPAVAGVERHAVTFHYLTGLDARALRTLTPRQVQEARAERRAARRAPVILAYSRRVAEAASPRAVPIPVAYPVPPAPLEPVPEPVAAVVADWRWPPNRRALRLLLEIWPAVRARVSSARLLLAGRGLEDVAASDGVAPLGPVARSVEVLSRAALVPFPCPDTSGPKIKVLEALALGLAVVTTPAGVEGLAVSPGRDAAVVPVGSFADALARLLADPSERARLAAAGRAAALASHAPIPAARARIRALTRARSTSERETPLA